MGYSGQYGFDCTGGGRALNGIARPALQEMTEDAFFTLPRKSAPRIFSDIAALAGRAP